MKLLDVNTYTKLERASQQIFKLLSENISINTFCITNVTDDTTSQIIHVFNREKVLFESGASLPLGDAY